MQAASVKGSCLGLLTCGKPCLPKHLINYAPLRKCWKQNRGGKTSVVLWWKWGNVGENVGEWTGNSGEQALPQATPTRSRVGEVIATEKNSF